MLKLYNYFRSSASFRVRIALNLKGLDYKKIPIHLVNHGGEQHSAEYAAINPQSLVPALSDNEKIITQSMAIIEYLEEKYPTPPLLPTDHYQRALVRAFSLAIAADTHPLNNLRVLNYLKDELNISEDQKNKWYQHWIAKSFSALETQLASSVYTGDYCFGNSPTMADIFLVPQMFNARRFSCDLSAYPTLTRIDAHCQQHVAFITAHPEEVEYGN
jgi:maleylpyruvate isomerase